MSLYNDLRPEDWDEVYGNVAVLKALKSFVEMEPEKRPHAYLFVGPSGCGKTTLARILADKFKCNKIDLVELNAANTRGIDTIREINNIAPVLPMGGESRVFIIDESHQLTKQAQQAFLKIIEDTPIHSYFMFCSTDPQMIITTIKNRCTMLQVQQLDDDDMGELMDDVIHEKKFVIPNDVYYSIIKSAEGSPRKMLVLLEKVVTTEDKKEQLSFLEEAEVEHDVIDLCRALLKGVDWEEIVEIYKGLSNYQTETVRRGICGYMKSVLLGGGSNVNVAAELISIFEKNTYDTGEATFVRMLFDATH